MSIKLTILFITTLSIHSYSQYKIVNLDSIKYSKIKTFRIKSITELEFEYKKGIIADSAKIEEYNEYEENGNLVKVIRPNNSSPFLHGPLNEDSVHYKYDSLGQLIGSSNYFWNKTRYYENYYVPYIKIETTFDEERNLTDSTVNYFGDNGKLSYFISYKDQQAIYRGKYLYDKFYRLSKYLRIGLKDNHTIVNRINIFNDKKRILKEISLNYKNDTMSVELTKYNINGYKVYYSYNSFWDKFSKENYFREDYYEYNENNNLSKEIRYVNQRYDGKTMYKYDEYNKLISSIYYLEDDKPFILNVFKYEFFK